MDAKLQQANDMLQAALNQRNAAQNECVQLAAQLMAANRRIAELEKATKAEDESKSPAPSTNGHAEVHQAA